MVIARRWVVSLFFAVAWAPRTETCIADVSEPTPMMTIDFGKYAETAAFFTDCNAGNYPFTDASHTFVCSGDVDTPEMLIDPTVVPPGGGKSLRYHYNHGSVPVDPGTPLNSGCNTISVTRDFYFPNDQQEVWAEFPIKWSTNFTTGGQVPAHVCDPNDFKLIGGLVASNSGRAGRWMFYAGSDTDPAHHFGQERPWPLQGGAYFNLGSHAAGADVVEPYWASGAWHVIRLHIRNSTTGTSNDGVWEIWIDGVLRHQQTGFSVSDVDDSPIKLRGFSIGRNNDKGPPNVDMYIWWGNVTVYNQYPGPGWGTAPLPPAPPAQPPAVGANGSNLAIRVHPNPWRADRSGVPSITFDQFTSNTDIKIFDMAGHLVKKLPKASSSVTWGLTNESGKRVASGIYLYTASNDQGQTTKGKVAVIK